MFFSTEILYKGQGQKLDLHKTCAACRDSSINVRGEGGIRKVFMEHLIRRNFFLPFYVPWNQVTLDTIPRGMNPEASPLPYKTAGGCRASSSLLLFSSVQCSTLLPYTDHPDFGHVQLCKGPRELFFPWCCVFFKSLKSVVLYNWRAVPQSKAIPVMKTAEKLTCLWRTIFYQYQYFLCILLSAL